MVKIVLCKHLLSIPSHFYNEWNIRNFTMVACLAKRRDNYVQSPFLLFKIVS